MSFLNLKYYYGNRIFNVYGINTYTHFTCLMRYQRNDLQNYFKNYCESISHPHLILTYYTSSVHKI